MELTRNAFDVPDRYGRPCPVYDVFLCRFDQTPFVTERFAMPPEYGREVLDGVYVCLIAPYYSRTALHDAELMVDGAARKNGILLRCPFLMTYMMLWPMQSQDGATHAARLMKGQWSSSVIPLSFHGQPAKRRGRLAAATLTRYDGPYIVEWIEYHLLLGFQHFFVYTNHAPDMAARLEPFERRGLVTRIAWDYPYEVYPCAMYPRFPRDSHLYTQPPQQVHALRAFGHLWDWIALFDADEFMVYPLNLSMELILQEAEAAGHDCIEVTGRWFGTAGLREVPARVIESYTRCEEGCTCFPKPIVRPQAAQSALVHWAPTAKPSWKIPSDRLRYNHYAALSDHKRRRGPEFDGLPNNACTDRLAIELRESRENNA